ncbi:MAG TPA: ATPase [Lactobacillus sp.]|nr:ATPase [Lactobacillus sp.]
MLQNQTSVILDPTGEYAQLPHAVVGKLGDNAFIDFAKLSVTQLAAIIGIHDDKMVPLLKDAVTSLRIAHNVCHQKTPYVKIGITWATYEEQLARLHDFPRPYNIRLLPDQLLEECIQPANDADADFSMLGQQYDHARQRQLVPVLAAIRKFLADPTMQRLFRLPDPSSKIGQRKVPVKTQYDVVYLLKMFAAMKAQHRFLVIDLSVLRANLTAGKLVVSILAATLLSIKTTLLHTVPIVLTVDEAHRYLTDAASQVGWVDQDGLSRVAREGRKTGLYLVLTTQSPLDIPSQLLGEFGNLLVHRVTTIDELAKLPVVNETGDTLVRQGVGEATLVGNGFVEPVSLKITRAKDVTHETESPRFGE